MSKSNRHKVDAQAATTPAFPRSLAELDARLAPLKAELATISAEILTLEKAGITVPMEIELPGREAAMALLLGTEVEQLAPQISEISARLKALLARRRVLKSAITMGEDRSQSIAIDEARALRGAQGRVE